MSKKHQLTATLPTRVLGKTGLEVSVLGLGCGTIGFGNVPHQQGVAVVRHALDRGITYIDTAHHYESEPIVGDALSGRRDSVVLATKTVKRNAQAARRDLEQSLRDLRTDVIDIYFMHCVNTLGDLDAVTGTGGSLEVAIEARRAGLVRHIGISGHARPGVLALALDRFPFDVVLIALGAMDHLVSAPELFFLPAARAAGCGVVGMKVLGCGRLTGHPDLALRYTLEQGAHTAIVGMGTTAQIDELAAAAGDPRPLTPEEEAVLMAEARPQVVDQQDAPFWLADFEVIAYRKDWPGAIAAPADA
ncbi:MAG TPA: aldo/keto reductase [Chloroflexota bacterium]|nr:aldo/keto reductase [Chloroflexota bacterium]